MLRGSSGISAIQGLHLHRSSTAYSQSQYSGSSRVGYCFPLLHCAALDGRKDVFEWMNKYFERLNFSAESKPESDQRSQDGLPQYFKLEAVYRLLTSTRTFTLPVPVIGSLPASVSVSKRRASHQSSRNGTSRVDLSSHTDSTLSLHLSTLYPTPHEVEQDHFPSGHHVHPHTNPDTSSLHLQCDLNVDTDCSLSSSTPHSNFHGDSVRSVTVNVNDGVNVDLDKSSQNVSLHVFYCDVEFVGVQYRSAMQYNVIQCSAAHYYAM